MNSGDMNSVPINTFPVSMGDPSISMAPGSIKSSFTGFAISAMG